MRWLISLVFVVCTSFCMAFPFTPHTTFTDDATPAIDAGFLNDLQGGTNASAIPGYKRIDYKAYSLNGTAATIYTQSFMILDSGTNQYVGIAAQFQTIANTDCTDSAWNYVYLVSTNGVVSVVVSTTEPDSTNLEKSDDSKKRFVCSLYVNGSSKIRQFQAKDGIYKFTETVTLLNTASSTAGAWNNVTMSGIKSLPITAASYTIRASILHHDASNQYCHFRSYASNLIGGGPADGSAPNLYAVATAVTAPSTDVGYFEMAESGDWSYYPSLTGLNILAVLDGMKE